MNPKYYVTPEEVKRVIDFLNEHSIGGGWKSSTQPNFVGPFQVPPVEGKWMIGLVLKNGCEMNAGLTLDLMTKGYPEWLVASMLQAMATPEPEKKDD
jgi:hypothetical protein